MKIISSVPPQVSKGLSISTRGIRSLCRICFDHPSSAVDRAADAALVTLLALGALVIIADELQQRQESQNPDAEELRLTKRATTGYRFLRYFFSAR